MSGLWIIEGGGGGKGYIGPGAKGILAPPPKLLGSEAVPLSMPMGQYIMVLVWRTQFYEANPSLEYNCQ